MEGTGDLEDKPFDSTVVPPEMPEGWTTAEAEGDQVREAEVMEYEVFLAEGYCEPSRHRRVEDFDPWRDRSHFMVVSSPDGTLHGSVRVMLGAYDELQVGTFERYREFPPDPVLEYASLAVPDHARQTGSAQWLYREVWRYALNHGAGGVVGVGEQWLMETLNAHFPFGFEQLGPSRWYMGGHCFPMGTRLIDLVERSRDQPGFFHWATRTIDLRDVPVESIRDTVIDMRTNHPR